jgi:Xaa-Pro aminopeptidase
MSSAWENLPPVTTPKHDGIAAWAHHRAQLAARFPGERLVIPAGSEQLRSGDTYFRFRPSSSYCWLGGHPEPDSVLLLEPDAEATARATVFTRPSSGRGTPEFYRDRRHGEWWVGSRPSLADIAATTGVACRPLRDLPPVLNTSPGMPTRVSGGESDRDRELEVVLAELRLVKDPWEIGEIRAAVDATTRGFHDVVRALPEAIAAGQFGERWVEGTFARRARTDGNDVGYPTIAAAGAHATVLHWTRNDGPIRPGELMLLDAGVETHTLYTADITRTLPVGGRFTPEQRRVYQLVYDAQRAGIAAVRPGARFRDFHAAAMAVIAVGLAEWGVLPVSAAESLRDDQGLHRRWTVHTSGHMLGMDVHDCAAARADTYLDGVLEPGHVLTVEPGLYFQPDDLAVPVELRGIGIRIEDDVVVTADGCEVLSAALPSDPDAVEEWMRHVGTE